MVSAVGLINSNRSALRLAARAFYVTIFAKQYAYERENQ